MIDITRINMEKLVGDLRRFENQWVAISEENKIVASGHTYRETLDHTPDPDKVVLLKVPSSDYSLAP